MSIKFNGTSEENFPLTLPFVVNGEDVIVVVLASPDVIHSEKIMKAFREGSSFIRPDTSKKFIAGTVIHDIANFLFREEEMEGVKPKYIFTLQQLLDL